VKITLDGVNRLLKLINRSEVIDKDITPMALGGNNRSYKIESDSEIFIVKHYFKNQFETHDRLSSEYLFLEHACKAGIKNVPKPLAKIDSLNIALYEFIEGISPKDLPLETSYVEAAASFLAQLNRLESKKIAKHLPLASDSCLNYKQHINSVTCRLEVLKSLRLDSDIAIEAKEFIQKLSDYSAIYLLDLQHHLDRLGINSEEIFPKDQLCLSPSDFGFHNAILNKRNEIYFIDFEYAGWDDLVKTIGDFIFHPANKITAEFSYSFLNKIYEFFPENTIKDRLKLLMPIFAIRWCCIVLNEFIPNRLEKRIFANPDLDIRKIQSDQLDKAKIIYEKLREGFDYVVH
jgi:hypothetical protein